MYLPLGEAIRALGWKGQVQYLSRYVDGRLGSPKLGVGLRFRGKPSDYHNLEIHAEDAKEFFLRVCDYEEGLHS